MRNARVRTQGFTLIASLLILLLLSGIAIGLMMMVNTEGQVGNHDLKNNIAYHAAEGGVEQMTSDLAAMFQTMQAPDPAQICALSSPSHQPYMSGITWKDYDVRPVSPPGTDPCTTALVPRFDQIRSGPNQGLWAQIVPVTMLATAAHAGGQEVSMTRSAQVALIPVFQFGVFSDSDLSFFSGPNFDFAGRVHTNGDLYPEVGPGSYLRFHDKLSVYGNVVRQQLANGYSTGTDYNGTVLVPFAGGGCDGIQPPSNYTSYPACRPLKLSEGSVTGAGGNPIQSPYNTSYWPNQALSDYQRLLINGNWGNSGGSGAKNLSLPFVGGGAGPFEIVRRPRASDTSALSASREYNMAQIRVLLSDDAAELPGGRGDPENVRLANVGNNQYGIATSTPAGLPAPPAGSTYRTYFAEAASAVPDATTCNNVACLPITTKVSVAPDWPAYPADPPAGADTMWPNGAPVINTGARPAANVWLCPPANVSAANTPAGCPAAGTGGYPYYGTAAAAAWNMLDGWLRVEYRDSNGVWQPVTNQWLGLGFARGLTSPNALPGENPGNAGSNLVNPNAILIFQQLADRNADGNPGTNWVNGIAPVCTTLKNGVCIAWTNPLPPEVQTDSKATGAGSTSPYFGLTSAGTVTQSVSRKNWYPINLYDTREGETRDTATADSSCAPAGVMNAVELDVGNLKRWLWGQIGTSGPNVDFLTQNGWVLYFSDRRGMLPNPNTPYNGDKSGDSGLEDSINAASAAGVPDGNLEPKPAGKNFSPEDVNLNTKLDNFGTQNVGLGFFNGATSVNAQIIAATPDNPYLPRIVHVTGGVNDGCKVTARKNWVSGARHALKLVDGGFGHVPYRQDGTLQSPGGLTVASENPVYVQGNYNSNAADPAWGGGGDAVGHAAAAVIADSVTLLSNNWSDLNSLTFPTTQNDTGQRTATTTYYRMAIAGGKNMNFPKPTWGGAAKDYGTDGGTHNFLRYLETWKSAGATQTLNYKGSLVSLYYSTYLTGVYKCCTVVYSPPVRNYSFDADFALTGGLPPGTPLFRDVDTLGYRQLFAVRDK